MSETGQLDNCSASGRHQPRGALPAEALLGLQMPMTGELKACCGRLPRTLRAWFCPAFCSNAEAPTPWYPSLPLPNHGPWWVVCLPSICIRLTGPGKRCVWLAVLLINSLIRTLVAKGCSRLDELWPRPLNPSLFKKKFLLELIYNVLSISAVQQRDPVVHRYNFFYSHISFLVFCPQ